MTMSTPDDHQALRRHIDATEVELCAELRRIADRRRRNNEALRQIMRDLDDHPAREA
jgi:hypothetical protein